MAPTLRRACVWSRAWIPVVLTLVAFWFTVPNASAGTRLWTNHGGIGIAGDPASDWYHALHLKLSAVVAALQSHVTFLQEMLAAGGPRDTPLLRERAERT